MMQQLGIRSGVWIAIALVVFVVSAAPALADSPSPADLEEYIRSHYTKHEYRIPMRDGVKLYTAIYSPRDSSETYPFMMIRTPYGCHPYGADRYPDWFGPTAEFAREGYIYVCQDVRGRYLSEGEFVNMRPHLAVKDGPEDVDESTDAHDTIEWLLAHVEGHNGRVGQWGNSYPGFYCSASMIDSHPALKAVSPNAPIADWFFDDMHHHGAFTLALSFPFFASFGLPRPEPTTDKNERFDFGTPDAYQFFLDLGPVRNVQDELLEGGVPFWTEMAKHPNYDEFWQSRNILPHLKNITAAVLTVGGLFDAEDLYGPFHTYRAIEDQNPGIFNVLVMGPWSHGAWLWKDGQTLGPADFGFATAEGFRARATIPFFRHYLKGEGELDLPEAWIFETGANRWRELEQWPPPDLEVLTFYLRDEGVLSEERPVVAADAFDEFPSDPSNPVPYTPAITTSWHSEYMVEDQRFAARRPDVLVYRSEPLEQDLTLAGELTARLWVSTTGTDADWVVKLIDEFPARMPGYEPPKDRRESEQEDLGGTQRMVRSEIFRGRFRNSYEHPEPFVPGEQTLVEVPLQGVLHTFKRGHRVMIQIQSTLFPLFDRNPQRYVPNIFEAGADDYIKAVHRVWRTAEHPSSIQVGVLPALAPVVERQGVKGPKSKVQGP
jgi:putative CocE/NonD family hydrolase